VTTGYSASVWLIVTLVVVGATASCRNESAAEQRRLATVSGTEFFEALEAERQNGQPILLDFRTPSEFAAGHAAGAVNHDFFDTSSLKPYLDSLDRNASYYIYCNTGTRSSQALLIMDEMGFHRVLNLAGGWQRNASRLSALDS